MSDSEITDLEVYIKYYERIKKKIMKVVKTMANLHASLTEVESYLDKAYLDLKNKEHTK
jgi:hypothetical protein